MIAFEAPCCDRPLTVESLAADAVRCDDCSIIWLITDVDAVAAVTDLPVALAA